MPSYNTGDFISRAIQSVIDQTYQDWELVIVDDASTDSSVNIIKEYTDKDSRIRLITKDTNGGAGLARRTGIENRDKSSKYLCFLDSDDYFKKDHLQILHDYSVRYDSDMTMFGMEVDKTDQSPFKETSTVTIIEKENSNFYEFYFKIDPNGLCLSIHRTFVRSSLFDKISYNIDLKVCEDIITFAEILYYVNTVVNIPYSGYIYTNRENSLSHQIKRDTIQGQIIRACLHSELTSFFKEKDFLLSEYFRETGIKFFDQLKRSGITEKDKEENELELSKICKYLLYQKIK